MKRTVYIMNAYLGHHDEVDKEVAEFFKKNSMTVNGAILEIDTDKKLNSVLELWGELEKYIRSTWKRSLKKKYQKKRVKLSCWLWKAKCWVLQLTGSFRSDMLLTRRCLEIKFKHKKYHPKYLLIRLLKYGIS